MVVEGGECLPVGLRGPAQFLASLRGVTEKIVDFGRTEVVRVHGTDAAVEIIVAFFIHAATLPLQRDAKLGSGGGDEIAH